jgi:hypothetical protein
MLTLIVGLSLALQVATIIYAMKLVRVTGWKTAWFFLAISIITMGIRRFTTFAMLSTGKAWQASESFYEVTGLVGSLIMLVGVILIGPIFKEITRSEAKQRELALELQAAMSNIKILSGLLPICASCKKIRDDKGYWNQMETYISEHSEALFTHAICPECGRKLYPDYYDRVWRKEDHESER